MYASSSPQGAKGQSTVNKTMLLMSVCVSVCVLADPYGISP